MADGAKLTPRAHGKFFDEHAAPEYDVRNGGTMAASNVLPIDEAAYKAAYDEVWKPNDRSQ